MCEKSLVFRFIRVARWVALGLLVGIGTLGAFLQYKNHQDINWAFFSICIICGIMLFWMGRCILKSECAARRRAVSCSKVSTIGNIPIS
jgi:hypothetical protein